MIKLINIVKRFFYIIYIVIKFNIFLLFIRKNKKNFDFTKNDIMKIRIGIEKLGPIFIKLAQIFSTRRDFFDIKIINEFQKLQDSVMPFNFTEIKGIIEQSFKINLLTIFKKINENPLASASVAQIHTAILHNGDKVIIKVLKPNIDKIIFYDLLIIKFIFSFLNYYNRFERYKLLDVLDEINNIFIYELDLKNEAAHISKFSEHFLYTPFIYSPKVYWELSNTKILTLEYLDGINILNLNKMKKETININNLIFKLFESFYLQFLKYNFFHADWHPGNILISKNNFSNIVIIFLDFGIVSCITNDQKIYLIENMLAFIKRDYNKIIKLHLQAGTITSNLSLQELENNLRFVFDPILNKQLKDISFKKLINDLLYLSKKVHLRLQPKMILFQKTLLSIESLARYLNSDLNLWSINRHLIEKIFVMDIILNKIKFNYLISDVIKVNNKLINIKINEKNFLSKLIEFFLSDFIYYFFLFYIFLLTILFFILEYCNFLLFFS